MHICRAKTSGSYIQRKVAVCLPACLHAGVVTLSQASDRAEDTQAAGGDVVPMES